MYFSKFSREQTQPLIPLQLYTFYESLFPRSHVQMEGFSTRCTSSRDAHTHTHATPSSLHLRVFQRILDERVFGIPDAIKKKEEASKQAQFSAQFCAVWFELKLNRRENNSGRSRYASNERNEISSRAKPSFLRWKR